MPRLVKGGKWVYSWVVIGAERKMPIPLRGMARIRLPGWRPGALFARQPALRWVWHHYA